MAKPKSNLRKVTLYLEDDQVVRVLRTDAYYKLGDQVDEVFRSETLMNAKLVTWCQISQEWV